MARTAPARRARRRRVRVPGWAVPLVVLGVLLCAEVGARFVGPAIPRTAGSEERLFVKSDQIFERRGYATQVVVLGSSESAGGFIPARMDEAARGLDGFYNAALAGMEPSVMRQWADRVVVPNLHPKVAVIGILPMTVQTIDTAGAENPLAAIDAYEAAIDQVDPGGFANLGWKLRQRSDLIRYRPYLRSPSLAAQGLWNAVRGVDPDPVDGPDLTMDWTKETSPAQVAANTAPDGEVYDYRQPSVPTAADPVGAALYNRFGRSGTDLGELQALVDGLRARGVVPVVAIAPADRRPLQAGGADLAPLDDVARQIEAWGHREGVPVNDQFTEEWASDLFHDRNHLDEAGARRWSTVVGSWLGDLCAAHQLADACGA